MLQAPERELNLASRRLLRLLLEAMEKDDLSAREEAVDHAVDVSLALLAQLPQLALQMAG